MPIFRDAANREWSVSVNVASIRRVKELAGLDLLDAPERWLADPVSLINAIYAICAPQAKAAGVTDEQFWEALVGEFADAAVAAFQEAFINFFPSPARRATIRKALALAGQMTEEALTAAEKQMTPEALREAAAKISGASFIASPESAE